MVSSSFSRTAGRGARLTIALLLSLATSLSATLLEKVEFDQLCQKADLVVVGRCSAQECVWDRSHTTILTVYTFAVSETVKGRAVPSVRVTTLGGIIGDQGQGVAGSPRFKEGDEYVLFLEPEPEAGWRCKGWTQGCYAVLTDPTTRVKTVRGDTTGVSLVGKGSSKLEEGQPGKPMGLSSFLDAVRGHAAAKREAK
ncbi:MAG: hypothetical protein HY814_11920 [Candidatus Riflebacteria bacterium]|nr:hypothetical protein [Candidatus Riflebacteria bacterium]